MLLKEFKLKNPDNIIFYSVILFTIIFGLINQDYYAAIINAVCGMLFTYLSGKGKPVCYLFGVIGSGFYCYLALKNGLWGNLLLYAGYYIPMQIIGFIQWQKHLKSDKNEIIKISTPRKERIWISLICLIICIITCLILIYFKDTHPVLDSITTILSLVGMYYTVRRAIEQWVAWMIVNTLSLIMWLHILSLGEKVYSTVIMWTVYTILAAYFYITWKKELDKKCNSL